MAIFHAGDEDETHGVMRQLVEQARELWGSTPLDEFDAVVDKLCETVLGVE